MHDVINVKELIVNKLDVQTSTDFATGTVNRNSQVYNFPCMDGKDGATGTVGYNTDNDTAKLTLAQNATADTWVVPLQLKNGDIINSFRITGQIDSAGNTATVDADLRAITAVSTGSTDASIGAITQISKTADYEIDDEKTGLTHTIISGNTYYVLITCTTGATTDIELGSIEVTINEK